MKPFTITNPAFADGTKVLLDKYTEKCNHPSDINQLLPYLKEYADKCETVVEMGVRTVVSTYAFLASSAKKVIGYDIETQPEVAECIEIAKNAGKDFVFIEADVLKTEIEPVDFLFIDTFHTYSQLKAELALHASKAKKYIGFHDTTSFEFVGEQSYASIAHNAMNCGRGLWPAIEEFLAENPEWKIDLRITFNNGLTILKKN
jgi:hypothetical protein